MRPDFKTIDITKDAFGAAHAPMAAGEEWLTPELIPVKPVYTKEDLEGLEHHLPQYRDEDQEAPELPRPEPLRRLHAVHALHLDIQKQDVYLPVVFQQLPAAGKPTDGGLPVSPAKKCAGQLLYLVGHVFFIITDCDTDQCATSRLPFSGRYSIIACPGRQDNASAVKCFLDAVGCRMEAFPLPP